MGAERLLKLINKLENFQDAGIEQVIEQAVDKVRPLMEDLNREQLNAGVTSTGNRILEKYRPKTLKYKAIMGQQLDPPNLKDKGHFHDEIEAKKFDGYIEMQSNDAKEEMLMDYYGEDILGLSDEHKVEVSQEMLPDVIKLTRKFLKL